MWKREEAAKPVAPDPVVRVAGPGAALARSGGSADREVNIGKSVVIKGELNGSEDLTIEGQVEGKIELTEHVLTIGPHGRIRAEVVAKCVVVLGEVIGNIRATEKVAILDKGAVEGDITAPKVAIAEGSRFRGNVDMRPAAQQGQDARPQEDTATAPDQRAKTTPQSKPADAKPPQPAKSTPPADAPSAP